MMEVMKYKRGQIWWYKTGDNYNGSIQGKTRPVIIMSNELANKHSDCLLGIPCTTAEKKDLPTHTTFRIDGTYSTALAENMLSINKNKLMDYIGSVDDELLGLLEQNILIALGLTKYMPDVPAISKSETTDSMEILNVNVDDIGLTFTETDTTKKRKHGMTTEEKQRFLNDFETHDKDFMLKKYNIKDYKALSQKLYLIRKEFGVKIRNR